jgi:tRNA threonylcarbamoyladenosine biosynthesis protein TsaE
LILKKRRDFYRNFMKKQIFTSKSAKETQGIGKDLAVFVCAQKKRRGEGALVIDLIGDLGAGKTNFTKGIARGLGVKELITSPTFVIQKKYEITGEAAWEAGYRNFFHVDAYRLRGQKDAEAIGLSSIILNPSNIIVVEWGKNTGGVIQKCAIAVKLEISGKKSREITIEPSQCRS